MMNRNNAFIVKYFIFVLKNSVKIFVLKNQKICVK